MRMRGAEAQVVCVGNVTSDRLLYVDSFPALDEVALVTDERSCVGGRGALVALILAALDVPVVLCTVVGRGGSAGMLRFLREHGVGTEGIARDPDAIGTSEVMVTISGTERDCTSLFVPRPIAFRVHREQIRLAKCARVLYLTTHDLLFNDDLLLSLDGSEQRVVVNFSGHMLSHGDHVRRALNQAHVLIANEADADRLKKWLGLHEISAILDEQDRLEAVIVTMGNRGAMLWDRRARCGIPARPSRPLTPVGIGDAFAAGVVYACAKGLPLKYGSQIGAVLAAESIESRFSYPELPGLRHRVERALGITRLDSGAST